jgi:hypothetical protein
MQLIHCRQQDERKDVELEHQTQRTHDRFGSCPVVSSSPARWHCCAARNTFQYLAYIRVITLRLQPRALNWMSLSARFIFQLYSHLQSAHFRIGLFGMHFQRTMNILDPSRQIQKRY